jgi:hypothetical protein
VGAFWAGAEMHASIKAINKNKDLTHCTGLRFIGWLFLISSKNAGILLSHMKPAVSRVRPNGGCSGFQELFLAQKRDEQLDIDKKESSFF